MKSGLLTRYEQDFVGVLGFFDRVVVTGTLTEVAYPHALNVVGSNSISRSKFFGHGLRSVS
jgi:hypothetical protein